MREIEELSQYLADEKVRGLRKALGKDIQEKLSKSGIYFHIFSRLKSAGSIWHKLEWKKEEYIEKDKKLQDLIGIRIVLYYMDDVSICKELLKETYSIIEKDSHEDIPKVNEFNPIRMNYVCRMPEEISGAFPKNCGKTTGLIKPLKYRSEPLFLKGGMR